MPGGTYPGPEEDVTAALAAVAARPEVDASRMVVVGHSAGATLAMRTYTEGGVLRREMEK